MGHSNKHRNNNKIKTNAKTISGEEKAIALAISEFTNNFIKGSGYTAKWCGTMSEEDPDFQKPSERLNFFHHITPMFFINRTSRV